MDEAASIIRDCDRKQGGFSQIPRAYIALRDEINAEYKNAAFMRKQSSLTNTYRA